MRDRLDELGADTIVVLVTFTDHDALDGYLDHHELPFVVLSDRQRAAYRAYGLGRGRVWRVWGWRAGREYLRLMRRGFRRLRRPTEDTLQLGGDFVVDRAGRLRYGYWGEGPDDRPTVDEIVAAVRALDGSVA